MDKKLLAGLILLLLIALLGFLFLVQAPAESGQSKTASPSQAPVQPSGTQTATTPSSNNSAGSSAEVQKNASGGESQGNAATPPDSGQQTSPVSPPSKIGIGSENSISSPTGTASGGSQVGPASSPQPQNTSTDPEVIPQPGEEELKIYQFDMVAKKWSFEPSTITLKKGRPAKLRITVPSGDVDHGFAIDEFGVNYILPAGATTAVDFTPQKAGTFSAYCSVYCGSGHSEMKATIIVEG